MKQGTQHIPNEAHTAHPGELLRIGIRPFFGVLSSFFSCRFFLKPNYKTKALLSMPAAKPLTEKCSHTEGLSWITGTGRRGGGGGEREDEVEEEERERGRGISNSGCSQQFLSSVSVSAVHHCLSLFPCDLMLHVSTLLLVDSLG